MWEYYSVPLLFTVFSYSENNGEYIKVMSEIGGRYINLFHATTDFQVNNELQFGVQDYG